ncbi:dodecin domain-containing protein [Ornithinimicrobium ciconiae]|uniref:Dodecin domain-containing protein n=1 Tax=Ornithinimicrobium ciconiae TaxID=2594265 RepID=A0A516G7T3_9MICO|nr:dodecin [Ornithinimicrobium ciconiae]QDO87587.1 dodecin domain-containing protein [Ornithinimicrobium ciconiae]
MANHVYAISELVGSSPDGVEAAVANALTSASSTVRNLDWFEVTQIRGHLGDDGQVADWQVGIKLGFRVDK